MAVTITDWGIEHNGVRKFDGAHIAGQGAGFVIWAIVEQSGGGLKTADGYDWKVYNGGYFKTADSNGEYTSAHNSTVIEGWMQGVL